MLLTFKVDWRFLNCKGLKNICLQDIYFVQNIYHIGKHRCKKGNYYHKENFDPKQVANFFMSIKKWVQGQNRTISYYISVLYQSYISPISIIWQAYLSHISVLYQSYISHISVITTKNILIPNNLHIFTCPSRNEYKIRTELWLRIPQWEFLNAELAESNILYLISVIYQSYISHISVLHQSNISHISVLYQSYVSHISVIYQSYISPISVLP